MADDIGADFLKGYFDMANMRQDRINRGMQAQNFAAEMQLRQQEFQLNQSKFDQEKLNQAQEQEHRKALESHQFQLEQQSQDQADWARSISGFDRQASGQAVQATGTPKGGLGIGDVLPPSSGIQTMDAPKGGISFGQAGFLRPSTPEEQATRASNIKTQTESADAATKLKLAQDSLGTILDKYPDSTISTDKEFQSRIFAHMLNPNIPFSGKPESVDQLMSTEADKYLSVKFGKNSTDEQKADAEKRLNTILPIVTRLKESSAGLTAGIHNAHEDAVLNREAEDSAQLRDRATGILQRSGNAKPSAAERNAAVNAAAEQIDAERSANKRPPLHPKAVNNVMANEERGIAINPKGGIDLGIMVDPKTGRLVPKTP